jgi:deoxyhypusine synthase
MTDKAQHLSRPAESIEVQPRSISELLEAMGRTGFQGRSLASAVDVLVRMIEDEENTIFFGYAGSMSTTGQSKIASWLIENRFVDVVVSTGANVSEDVFEGLGYSYYQGSPVADDAELLQHQIDRFYDIYADELQYRELEAFIAEFISTLDSDRVYSSADFLRGFGAFQNARGVRSITATAARAGVPVFSPGLADSGYGVAATLLARERGHAVVLDQFADFRQLAVIGERAGATSVVYVGGGVPKDTIQLVTVMVSLARGGDDVAPHKYAVQITTDSPQWGGLSGCTFEEAISWGKIDEAAVRAVCYCDATIALPILAHALLERGVRRKNPPDLSWIGSEEPAAGTPEAQP